MLGCARVCARQRAKGALNQQNSGDLYILVGRASHNQSKFLICGLWFLSTRSYLGLSRAMKETETWKHETEFWEFGALEDLRLR